MLDPVFVALSWIGSFGLVWIAFAVVAAIAWRRTQLLVLVAAAVLTADVVGLALKHAIGRPRPFTVDADPAPIVGTPIGLSFPSGHAATSFAGATLLALAVRRAAVPLFLLAAGVAWSRVYVGVHYPLDILAGALLGAAVALAADRLARGPLRAPRSPAAAPRRLRRRLPPG